MTRVFCAALATETNTFGPLPTERRHFEEWFLYPAGAHPDDGPTLFTGPLWAARQRAQDWGWEVVEGLCAAAFPSGRTVRKVYEDLRDELLSDLRAAGRVDIVLLGLHGAMCADGYDDCEGDLLARVRDCVGPDAIVGVELDPHCHLTSQMIDAADILSAFQEYPHTDALERAEHLVALCRRAHEGEISPVTAIADVRASAQYFTKEPPALELVNAMKRAEAEGRVLSASLGHSFASGDVADMGVKAWVITDNDPATAEAVAGELADMAWDIRETAGADRQTIDEVLAGLDGVDKPVVLAEGADNPGGGAPCDATDVLRALMAAGVGPFAAGPIWDPMAVDICCAKGVGARFALRLGGKASALSGLPLDLDVEVLSITENAKQRFGGGSVPLGVLVGLRAGDAHLAVASVRNQALTREVFTQAGIDLAHMRVILVKSNHHFRDDFAPIAGTVMYLQSQGVAVCDPVGVPYRAVARPLWPLDPADEARAARSITIKPARPRAGAT